MLCPMCETECPEHANFCLHCGRPLNRYAVGALPPRQLRWEFKELVIPLEASSRLFWEHPEGARARFLEKVRAHLDRASLEGWEPDEPIDFDSLKANGRIEEVRHRRYGHISVYNSVTIRLRRAVRV